jgi:hypothetical protein
MGTEPAEVCYKQLTETVHQVTRRERGFAPIDLVLNFKHCDEHRSNLADVFTRVEPNVPEIGCCSIE